MGQESSVRQTECTCGLGGHTTVVIHTPVGLCVGMYMSLIVVCAYPSNLESPWVFPHGNST